MQVTGRDPVEILNVGSGGRPHPDWTNLDLLGPLRLALQRCRGTAAERFVRHRLPRPLPFPESSFEAIYCAQVVEHFDRADGARMLREFHRVLRPGGVARVIVPDLEMQCRHYLELVERGVDLSKADEREEYEFAKLWLLDQFVRTTPGGEWARFVSTVRNERLRARFRISRNAPSAFTTRLAEVIPRPIQIARVVRHGELHRWAYDSVDLLGAARQAGFSTCEVFRYDQSSIAAFVEFDQDVEGELQPGSIYVEMIK